MANNISKWVRVSKYRAAKLTTTKNVTVWRAGDWLAVTARLRNYGIQNKGEPTSAIGRIETDCSCRRDHTG